MDATEETPKPRRRWWVRALRLLLVLSGIGLLLLVVGGAILGWLYRQHVIVDPGPHLERSHVMSIIAQESPVYYRDGTTRIGVFFEDEHRQYVPWEEMPPAYVAALVAAEDGSYWSHHGVAPKHVIRALRDNAVAGRTVSGGSTLTQQTAKNLYYRPDRSWKAKGTELVNALRLEAHYDKSEILTFYANQFHVSGNGRGLGIATPPRRGRLSGKRCSFIHRYSSACGRCCVCFVLDPVSVHGPKPKHTKHLPQADE